MWEKARYVETSFKVEVVKGGDLKILANIEVFL